MAATVSIIHWIHWASRDLSVNRPVWAAWNIRPTWRVLPARILRRAGHAYSFGALAGGRATPRDVGGRPWPLSGRRSDRLRPRGIRGGTFRLECHGTFRGAAIRARVRMAEAAADSANRRNRSMRSLLPHPRWQFNARANGCEIKEDYDANRCRACSSSSICVSTQSHIPQIFSRRLRPSGVSV